METGKDIEARAVNIAATLSVPEFVYRAPIVRKGPGVREVGDGLILCGAGGAVLQVKARSRHEGLRDSEQAASRWVLKNVARAVRQGQGSKRTIKTMQNEGAPLTALPVRSLSVPTLDRPQFQVTVDKGTCDSWPIIVIIDHPKNPKVRPPYYENVFCVTLNDWQELNRHLRSVHEMLRYIEEILSHGKNVHIPLGMESERFASLAHLDESYAARAKGALGRRSFAAVIDPKGLAAYRVLIARTWGPNDYLPGLPIEDYRPVLDYLDDAPAVVQAYVGRWLLERHEELRRVGHRVSGTTLLVDRPLVYMCDDVKNTGSRKDWVAQIVALTTLRACEWREQGWKKTSALGIAVRFGELENEYTYLLARQGARLPDRLRRTTEWIFGVANFSAFHTHSLMPGRNDECPCGSGRKYKHCHGSGQRTR